MLDTSNQTNKKIMDFMKLINAIKFAKLTVQEKSNCQNELSAVIHKIS